jgi:hypothetical protein
MSWMTRIRTLFGGAPAHEAAGRGRRALAWMPGNPGAVAAMLATSNELRVKSRDLVRRNAWANAGIEAFVANAVGTGIKPQSMAQDETFRVAVQALWRDWTEEADATGQTDFYGLQSLAARAMCEGGECFIRLRPRRPEDRLIVPLQLQLLEAEHLPLTLNCSISSGETDCRSHTRVLPCSALRPIPAATMASADFLTRIPAPHDASSTMAPVRISPGMTHPPSRLYLSDLRHSVPCKFRALTILAASPRCNASYPLPVRQASALPSASSRFAVTRDTLAVQLTLPLAGRVEDLHL